MIHWSNVVRQKLKNANVDVWFSGGYVDDLRYLVSLLDSGWRWSDDHDEFVWTSEDEDDDEREELRLTDSAPLPVSNQICLPSKTVTVPDCNNATGLDWQPPCPLDLQPEGLGHLSEISIRSLNDCANNNVVDENCPPVYVKDTSTKPKLDSATTTTMQDSGDKKASLLVGSCPPVPSLGELDTDNTCPPTSKQNVLS